jgi:leucyl/phenylalanyl-tRNA---protein transferase
MPRAISRCHLTRALSGRGKRQHERPALTASKPPASALQNARDPLGLTRPPGHGHGVLMTRARTQFEITPDILLRAYSIGLFPMAESAEDQSLFWVDPEARGIFPLDHMIVSKKLARTIRSDRFEIRVDHDFAAVIDGCAQSSIGREKTWINERIRTLYGRLFELGHVHTVESWQDGELVGGLYGVALGAAFFGESMFHRRTDASKVALIHLAARLFAGGFRLLDTQFVTPHLESLGALEVSKETYRIMLANAVAHKGDFWVWPKGQCVPGREALAALPNL